MMRKAVSKRAKTKQASTVAKYTETGRAFVEDFSTRKLLMQAAFQPPQGLGNGSVEEQVNRRGWQSFSQTPSQACVELVREFCANLKAEPTQPSVFVRGFLVDFSPAAINRFLGVPEVEECEYLRLYADNYPIDFDPFMEQLVVPGTDWIPASKASGGKDCFPENTLNRVAKTWHKFICHNLLPTSHDGDVTPDRCALLYAICAGWPVDVGRVIRKNMEHATKSRKPWRLPHGSLIHDMCCAAGVKVSGLEEVDTPKRRIDEKFVKDLVIWKGGKERDSGLGWYELIDKFPPPPLPARVRNLAAASSSAAAAAAAAAAPAGTEAGQPTLADIYNKMCELSAQLAQVGEQLAEFERRQLAMARYQHGLDPLYSMLRDFIASQPKGDSSFRRIFKLPQFPMETLAPYPAYQQPPTPLPPPPPQQDHENEDMEA